MALSGIYGIVWHLWHCLAFMALSDIYGIVWHLWHCLAFMALSGIYGIVWHLWHCLAFMALNIRHSAFGICFRPRAGAGPGVRIKKCRAPRVEPPQRGSHGKAAQAR